MTDGAAFLQLEEEFRHAFEMTVIDLPRNMLINFPQLLNDVNVVIIVTELTLASARDTIRLLSWLKTNASHAHVVVVANKVQPGVGEISKADFESSIERKIGFSIAYDIKAAANAAKLGQTFCEANRTNKSSAAIRDIAKMVMGASDEVAVVAASPAKKSLLGKIDVKSMLAKKTRPSASAKA
jgi:pilus assembly protein CpaE